MRKKNYEYSFEELVGICRDNPDFKSPWFPWYINDFLGSTRVLVMEIEAVGAYILLLSVAWNEKDGGLPDDDRALSKLSRAGDKWDSIKESIRVMFKPYKDRLYNRKLLEERVLLISKRQQAINASRSRRMFDDPSCEGLDEPTDGTTDDISPDTSDDNQATQRAIAPPDVVVEAEAVVENEIGSSKKGRSSKRSITSKNGKRMITARVHKRSYEISYGFWNKILKKCSK